MVLYSPYSFCRSAQLLTYSRTACILRSLSSLPTQRELKFGVLFDIDGVIIRGKNVLPGTRPAFEKLLDRQGHFRVPTVFATNSGSTRRREKAKELSAWIGTQVHEDQVVLAHSPLCLFNKFHQKRVLVIGQGPVIEIAKDLGFTNATTLAELRAAFPMLDVVDKDKRVHLPSELEKSFHRIEAIAIFGEPNRWETALQLLTDLLMTNGLPTGSLPNIPNPHIPILACNMDLQWMATANMPRFGNGAFLGCLESLYKSLTSLDLTYTALLGKPSELTYYYAEQMIAQHARKIGIGSPIKHLYMVGDNINTDIFGANLYDQYLNRATEDISAEQRTVGGRIISHDLVVGATANQPDAQRCFSVLVKTGVYSADRNECLMPGHLPRDFEPVDKSLLKPNYTTENILQAVECIFEQESYQ